MAFSDPTTTHTYATPDDELSMMSVLNLDWDPLDNEDMCRSFRHQIEQLLKDFEGNLCPACAKHPVDHAKLQGWLKEMHEDLHICLPFGFPSAQKVIRCSAYAQKGPRSRA